jgi:hypothetical protein
VMVMLFQIPEYLDEVNTETLVEDRGVSNSGAPMKSGGL